MPINTKDFKTRSEIIPRDLPKLQGKDGEKGKTIIALDGGYSGVKGVGPTRVFSFPAYAKVPNKTLDIVGKLRPTDLQLRDNTTGITYLVGESAESLMEQSDIDSTTDASLYTRYRYDSNIYRAEMTAGLALGLMGTGDNNEIFLQTGLPATYKDRDAGKLKKSLAGDYDISLKVGNGDFVDFKFSLPEDHIDVMEQPQGTLCAAVYDNGEVTEDGKDILKSSTIIVDTGFGTEDVFSIRSSYKDGHETYTDTAMKAVFNEVIKRLTERYPIDEGYKIFEFQKYLETGKAPYFDTEEFGMNYIEFADILEEVNNQMCKKSIERLVQEYDYLKGCKYLIVTGGTGESRYEQTKEMLKKWPELKVLPGNLHTKDLGFAYSNVIGYYMFRYAYLNALMKKKA